MKLDFRRQYQYWHNDTPAHRAAMIRHFRGRLAPHLPPPAAGVILDLGCGTGFALEALRALGYSQLEGIDADEGQAAIAIERGLPVVHVTDTPRWLLARGGRYQAVVLFDVLEHIRREEQFEFLAAIHTALQPGGRLLCTVPNANSTLGHRHLYNDWTHHSSFTEYSLDFALYHGGFRQIHILADDGTAPRVPWLPRWRMRWWYLRWCFRAIRRLQLISEYGPVDGRKAPLSLNLLAIATK